MHRRLQPSVAAIEDLNCPNCIGAYWCEINTTVHKGFGMSGTLTNGVARDLGDLSKGFSAVAGGLGPSHSFVHVSSNGQPVRVMGLEIRQSDLVHADLYGAVAVLPDAIAPLGVAMGRLQDTERPFLGPARQPGFDSAAFEAARIAFKKARTRGAAPVSAIDERLQ